MTAEIRDIVVATLASRDTRKDDNMERKTEIHRRHEREEREKECGEGEIERQMR